MARYMVVFGREAEADLAVFTRGVQVALRRDAERCLGDQPLPAVGRRKALDPNLLKLPYRLQAGDYRLYYDVDEDSATVWVLRVGYKPRETVYLRGKPVPMRD